MPQQMRDEAGNIWNVDAAGNYTLAHAAASAPHALQAPNQDLQRPKIQGEIDSSAQSRQHTVLENKRMAAQQPYDAPKSKAELQALQLSNQERQHQLDSENAPIDKATITYYAQQVLAGAPMPAIGMGKQAAAVRQSIMSEVARLGGAAGLTGADQAAQLAHYKAGTQQIANLEKMVGTVGVNEQTALANGQQYIDRSSQLPGQTPFSTLNAISNQIQRMFGGTAISAADAAYNTFTNEYAKVVSGSPNGSGTLSDSARHEAMSTINGSGSQEQKQAAFDQMKTDMANRMVAMHGGINNAYKALTQRPGYQVPTATTALPTAAANGRDDKANLLLATPGSSPPGGGNHPGGGTPYNPLSPITSGPTKADRNPEREKALDAALRSGAPLSSINAISHAMGGIDIPESEYTRMKTAVDKGYTGPTFDTTAEVPTSLLNRVAGSDTGTFFGGAADAAMGGTSDELGGVIQSIINGRPIADNIAELNAAKQASFKEHGKSAFAGQAVGSVAALLGAGKLLKALPMAAGLANPALAADLGVGALTGAGQDNDNRLVGAIGGATGAAVGHGIGALLAKPLGALARTDIGTQGINVARSLVSKIPGMGDLAPIVGASAPSAAQGEILKAAGKAGVPDIMSSLDNAEARNLPFSLADTSPRLADVAGQAARRSPDARSIAQSILGPRAEGQIGRFDNSVQSELGPIGNTVAISKALADKARTDAGPLYDIAYGKQIPQTPELESLLNTSFGKSALKKALPIMSNERVPAQELGYALDADGNVKLNPAPLGPDISSMPPSPSAGMYDPVKAPNEMDALGRMDVQSPINGMVTIPKRGPMDMVTWLRTQGGLRPQDGELSHYGIDNTPRNGMEFAGGEGRFGKLVDPERGMYYDDASQAAHEAGFFPDHADRPSVDEFLSRLNDTHSGNNRAFRMEDYPQIEAFNAARGQRGAVINAQQEGTPLNVDRSQPMTEQDFNANAAPFDQRGPTMEPDPIGSPVLGYNMKTLDYAKRGMDDVLEQHRNDLTGRLELKDAGRAQNNVKHQFLSELDQLNPAYAEARKAYAGPMESLDALQRGQDFHGPSVDANQIAAHLADQNSEHIAQMQLGYRDQMMAKANSLQYSSNPWSTLYSPKAQDKLAAMYPESAGPANLIAARDGEMQMAKTRDAILGGSSSAKNLIADGQFMDGVGPAAMVDIASAPMTGGFPVSTVARLLAKNKVGAILEQRTQQKADEALPMLLNTDPTASRAILQNLMDKQAAYQAWKAQMTPSSAMGRVGAGIGLASTRGS